MPVQGLLLHGSLNTCLFSSSGVGIVSAHWLPLALGLGLGLASLFQQRSVPDRTPWAGPDPEGPAE